jgi:hypothetical protein
MVLLQIVTSNIRGIHVTVSNVRRAGRNLSVAWSDDESHAERAFEVLDEAVILHGWNAVYLSVRDAFVATSLHYDGMLQAATGVIDYWNGSLQ